MPDIPPAVLVEEIDLRSIKDAAAAVGISPTTLRRILDDGHLTEYGTTGKRLVDVHELVAYLRRPPSKKAPHER